MTAMFSSTDVAGTSAVAGLGWPGCADRPAPGLGWPEEHDTGPDPAPTDLAPTDLASTDPALTEDQEPS